MALRGGNTISTFLSGAEGLPSSWKTCLCLATHWPELKANISGEGRTGGLIFKVRSEQIQLTLCLWLMPHAAGWAACPIAQPAIPSTAWCWDQGFLLSEGRWSGARIAATVKISKMRAALYLQPLCALARAISIVQNIISVFFFPQDGTTIPLSHTQPSPAVLTGVKRPASHKFGLHEEGRAKPWGFMHPQSNFIHLRARLGAKTYALYIYH